MGKRQNFRSACFVWGWTLLELRGLIAEEVISSLQEPRFPCK